MTKPIEKLILHNFRGASGKCEIVFDTSKSLVMIFGENGTGKSTIVDAIDFVFNENLGSLESRSMGGQRHPYLPTISKKATDVKVEATGRGQCWTGHLSGKSIQIKGASDRPRVRILRRAKLLQLVEAEPADRYKVLQNFIDVTKVEKSEQSLRDAERSTSQEYETAVSILNEATTALDVLWQQERTPGNSAEFWAKEKSEGDQSNLNNRCLYLKSAMKLFEALAARRDAFNEAERVLKEREHELQLINDEIAGSPQISGAQSVELVQLLQQAQAVIAEPNAPRNCPVCEQPIEAGEVRKSIIKRLSSMDHQRRLAHGRTNAEKQLHTARTNYDRAVSSYIGAVRAAASKVRENQPLSASTTWQQHESFLKDVAAGAAEVPAAKLVDTELAPMQLTFEKTFASVQADMNQFNAIKGHYHRIVSNRENAKKLETLHQRLKRTLKICEDTRRQFAQTVLNDVEHEVNRLYSIIHPNESLGPLRLSMDPNKRGSVDQDATFIGHGKVPPQAYFSESHLDTLGFCVWLALAKREHPAETVITLDDIFTSVDGVHLTRIMQLLAEIIRDFEQVIVTTHYRTWRDRYRLPYGPSQTVQLLELHRWTLERGVCLSGTKLAIQELEAALQTQPLDRQAVASRGGILLEAVLDRLTLQYRRRVPRTRDGDLTIGDLLGSCKKLFDVLTVERSLPSGSGNPSSSQSSINIAVQPFFQETGAWVFIRNQVGCHFSFSGSEVVDADVETFGQATVNLVRAMTCPNCGDLPDRGDGTHFRCSCKQTKMAPLEYEK